MMLQMKCGWELRNKIHPAMHPLLCLRIPSYYLSKYIWTSHLYAFADRHTNMQQHCPSTTMTFYYRETCLNYMLYILMKVLCLTQFRNPLCIRTTHYSYNYPKPRERSVKYAEWVKISSSKFDRDSPNAWCVVLWNMTTFPFMKATFITKSKWNSVALVFSRGSGLCSERYLT